MTDIERLERVVAKLQADPPASGPELPAIRKGQTWLFQGQHWRVHEVLTEGVIVLIGPSQMRDLNGVTAEELYAAGRLVSEPPVVTSAKAQRAAMSFARLAANTNPNGGRRPKKPQPPAELRPWRAAVLAVDTAKNSGWSIWVDGELLCSGEVNKDDAVTLMQLCTRIHGYDRPAVLMLESAAAFVYPGRSPLTLCALGAARQAWQQAWRAADGYKTRCLSVKPTRWRGQLFGGGVRSTLGKGGRVADFEKQWAHLQLRNYDLPARELGADECTAICIGCWAARAGEVGMSLPLKLRVHA